MNLQELETRLEQAERKLSELTQQYIETKAELAQLKQIRAAETKEAKDLADYLGITPFVYAPEQIAQADVSPASRLQRAILTYEKQADGQENLASDFQYEYSDEYAGYVIRKYIGYDVQKLIIPSSIDGYPVTAIGRAAFKGVSCFTSLFIPDSVKWIEPSAFIKCTGLTELRMSQEIISIGNDAFYGCSSLKSFVFPKTLKTIGTGAFRYTGFQGECVELPDTLESVGEGCFMYSRLAKAVIGIEGIPINCFRECAELSSVEFTENVKRIGARAFANTAVSKMLLPGSIEVVRKGTPDNPTLGKITNLAVLGLYTELEEDILYYSEGYYDKKSGKHAKFYPATIHCPPKSKAKAYAEKRGIKTAPLSEYPE